ncbi:VIT1/CCC1 transporter family protein [Candidatus Micrarchaeota archaeon]|nr:VIT1/CCC1 transporter family protein [Candidatus Micrarchaeota archaeon]
MRFYDSITRISKILRRYFVMNSFDGALTIFGMLLGSYVSGVEDTGLIIFIGMSTSIAIGVSGITSALLTEKAEQEREIKSMERALHRKLHDTEYKRAHDYATAAAGIVNGISPVLASLMLLSPFFFFEAGIAYPAAFSLAILVFFGLGIFLGKISKQNILLTGIKLVAVGIICMVIIFLLGAG